MINRQAHKMMAVLWVDSRRSSDWHSPTELLEFPLALIWTMGYGYEVEDAENGDRLVLASEFYPEVRNSGYRQVYSIPMSCVKEIKYLEEHSDVKLGTS